MKIEEEIGKVSDENVWRYFSLSKIELKRRGLVRTNNITGERGEFLAIETYKNNPKMPNLQAAPEGTQNVDALSRNGERYSIKTITYPGKTTGVFYGCGEKDDKYTNLDKKFEYLIVVLLDKELNLVKMIELSWDSFLKYRKWHSRMRAWNINITVNLLKDARIIFQRSIQTLR